ncbi:MerR family transcriptional regulator [Dysosmobacter sp. HCP28S3_G4]|uniref:MerR family transcriptional regulator n=1 Tax=Dysosmobacter sp. HCP28S3_G4 TaxID=3438938 RepID=UPI003F0AD425
MRTLKINEVEALVGITKKNIRFYEAEGLLCPQRNSENGYRNYGDEDVETLRRIKLLRKLGLPLEEIRSLQTGRLTVSDAMRRHRVTLERDRESLEQSIRLCGELADCHETLDGLDAQSLLDRMEQLEHAGTTFQNKQKQDIRVRYVAPVAIAVLTVVLMAALSALIIWGYLLAPEDAPPLPLMLVLVALPLLVAVGVVLALIQRIREIGRGEIDDARQF